MCFSSSIGSGGRPICFSSASVCRFTNHVYEFLTTTTIAPNRSNKPKKRNFRSGKPGGKPSFASNGKPSKRRSFNRRKKKPAKKGIDITKYINKNVVDEKPEVYEAQHRFLDFDIHKRLKKQIAKRGYKTPTEIQDKAIPHILEHHDLIGLAGTGTGKTAAFLVPIIHQLIESPKNLHALVVTPTRELANQINDEFVALTRGMKLFATTLIGGTSVNKSVRELRRNNHVIIGTPGRLIDMAERGALKMSAFQVLVLDEFDRMLDMGFSEDVKKINDQMAGKEQTLLFSATIDPSQKSLIGSFTDEPVEVKAGKGPQFTKAIAQDVVRIPEGKKKMEVLTELVAEEIENGEKIILFCETKRKSDEVMRALRLSKVRADVIHGDKTQAFREKVLRKFKKGATQVLVATDVVARGIDVSDVTLVINNEPPQSYNDYIHRIGRTGRAGKTGRALTLI